MIPSILPLKFLHPDEFDAIPVEERADVNNDLPYRVEHENDDGSTVWIGYGIREVLGACRVEPISLTPKGRLDQVRRAGRLCDTCQKWAPDKEVVCEELGETMVGYICNECYEEAINATQAANRVEQLKNERKSRSDLKARRKREKANRRNGRR